MDLNETLLRLQRERDFHRDQFDRVMEQKNKLLVDFKRLKEHRDGYERTLKALTQRYDTALRLRTLVGLETERVRKDMGRDTTRESDKSEGETTVPNVNKNVGVPSCTTQGRRVTERATENRSDKPGDILGLKGFENENTNGQNGTSIRFELRETSGKIQTLKVTSVKQVAKENEDISDDSNKERNVFEEVKQEEAGERSPTSFSLFCSIRAHHQPISCLELHSMKRFLASVSDDRTWKLWALPTNQEKVRGAGVSPGLDLIERKCCNSE